MYEYNGLFKPKNPTINRKIRNEATMIGYEEAPEKLCMVCDFKSIGYLFLFKEIVIETARS